MDVFDDDPATNAPVISVSELSGAVKRTVEGAFARVRVRGELGRVSRPRSGHVYLDLKDERSVLAGVIWKGVAARLAVNPEEGLEVVATGRLTTFPGQSRYQIVIEDLELAGQGALMALLEKRKAALAAEGLFDPSRKRPIPYLPRTIGVVTSPSGAVIRDILHRLRDRFPRHVLIWGVPVQGKGAEGQIAAAIDGFNRLDGRGGVPRPDVLIVARGGGSVEDLWCFNEEAVLRAVARSSIPVISAVGHETDTTLIDFVSDLRAPTPTAAAEHAVPVRRELMAHLAQLEARRERAMMALLSRRAERLRDLARGLPRADRVLDGPRQRLDMVGERLSGGLQRAVSVKRLRLSEAAGSLRPVVLRRQTQTAEARLGDLARRLPVALTRLVAHRTERLSTLAGGLQPARVVRGLGERRRMVAQLSARLAPAYRRDLAARHTRLDALDRLRETLGHRATLKRGFALVTDEAGGLITSAKPAQTARSLTVEFADGKVPLQIGEAAPKPKRRKSIGQTPPEQGSLF